MTREGLDTGGLGISGIVSPESQPEFRITIGDAVIFYSDDDAEAVDDFKERIRIEMEEKNCPVTIFLYDDLATQGTALQSVGAQSKLSVQHWFYITDNFCKDKDMMLHKDEQIIKSLQNNNSFIPLWTKPKEEFTDLPYGIQAFRGLYVDDARLTKKLEKMFSSREHLDEKERIRERREEEKARWRVEEEARIAEMARLAQEQHEKRMREMREAVQRNNPDVTLPRNEDELRLQYYLMEMKMKQLHLRQRSSPRGGSPNSPDGAMPEYLLNSLESHRSNDPGRGPRNVYNITINQPQQVNIGRSGESEEPGAETVLKNIAVNAENPNLNLTMHDRPVSMPTQESDRSAATSGSSFDVIQSSQVEGQNTQDAP